MSKTSNKIKVLHIITRLAGGGADENTIYIIENLDQEVYKVDLITGSQNLDSMINSINLPQDSKLYKVENLIRNIAPIKDLKAFIDIYKIIKKNKYDIVHTHIAKSGVLGRLAAKVAKVPLIIHSVHGITFPDTISPFSRLLFLNIERLIGFITDLFLPVGEDIKNKYIDAKIGNPENYKIIYSGMELVLYQKAKNYSMSKKNEIKDELSIERDKVVIGCVSSLEERKGHKYLLEVFKRLKRDYDNIVLVIAGTGNEKNNLTETVKKYNIEDDVIFTGYRDDIENIFSIMDIKVLTSLWEGLPKVLIQAAYMSIPIVTFDVEGVREVIDNGKNGFITDVLDLEDFYNKLSLLIKDKDLRKKMSQYSNINEENRWDYSNMVKEIEKVYQSLNY